MSVRKNYPLIREDRFLDYLLPVWADIPLHVLLRRLTGHRGIRDRLLLERWAVALETNSIDYSVSPRSMTSAEVKKEQAIWVVKLFSFIKEVENKRAILTQEAGKLNEDNNLLNAETNLCDARNALINFIFSSCGVDKEVLIDQFKSDSSSIDD